MREESGMAMGLAIFTMMLVGVMGAGLLVFVRSDLESVIEVNRGQQALDIADAGVQASRQQIMGDKIPAHYDVDDIANSNYLAASCNVDNADPGESAPRSPAGKNWSPEAGGQTIKSFVTASGQFNVTIRWMPQNPTADSRCIAPETTTTPTPGTEFFKVVSTGCVPDCANPSAKRRIETIQRTSPLNSPKAYYSPGKIEISGSACIENVSIFSSNNSSDGTPAIDFNGSGQCPNGTHMQGNDLYYGDWNRPPFNTTPRTDSLGTSVAEAGVAAPGVVRDSPRLGTRDYDRSTAKKFVAAPSTNPQGTDEVTFPFDLREQPDANRLCDLAKARGNGSYIEDPTTSNSTNFLKGQWPGSSPNTVLCYVFTSPGSHTLNWKVDDTSDPDISAEYPDCEGPIQDGTIVVRGGGFSVSPNVDLFRGVVVVRGAEGVESGVGSDVSGNGCLDGFINSTGPIKLAGSITPSNSDEVNNRPGFYGLRTWSWRELYE